MACVITKSTFRSMRMGDKREEDTLPLMEKSYKSPLGKMFLRNNRSSTNLTPDHSEAVQLVVMQTANNTLERRDPSSYNTNPCQKSN